MCDYLRNTIILVGLALILSGCNESELPFLSNAEQEELDASYEFALIRMGGEPRLQVKLSLTMPRDQIYLQLPNTFLRKDRLFDRIEALQPMGPHGVISAEKNHNNFKLLKAPKGQRIQVRYFVKPEASESMNQGESFYAPIIREDYVNFVGSMALVVPFVPKVEGPLVPMKIHWNMPADYEIFNSFGSQQPKQHISSNFAEMWDAVYTAGPHLRTYVTSVRGRPVTIALEGRWTKIADEEFVNIITRLLETQRATWRDDNFPYFFVSFLALGSGCSTNRAFRFAGSAHKNSFRAYFPTDCQLTSEMKQLISHELMHQWIGKKVKMGQKPGHIDGKWLTEGWTDYFGRILAYRAQALSEEEYFQTLNKVLIDYQSSKERDVTLHSLVERMYKRGYSTRQLEQVPYQQGEIMALRLNQKIKEISKFKYSLDDVMRDLLREAGPLGSKNFSVEEIEQIVDIYAPGVFASEYKKVIYGNKLLMPPLLPGCSNPAEYAGRMLGIYAYYSLGSYCSLWLQNSQSLKFIAKKYLNS
jgi:predicted metalloprotease with PDZ domain